MKTLILVAAIIQAVLGGGSHYAVRLPFLNPAGVTYLDGPAPAGLAAGPLQYAAAAPAIEAAHVGVDIAAGYAAGPALEYAAPAAAVGYAAPAVAAAPAAVGYAAPAVAAAPAAVGYAAPAAVGYAAPAAVGYAAPAAYGYAAQAVAPAPVAYAAAPVQTVTAVPTVHHVPGVADVPVTRVEARPGVVQKVVDVARPAVSTRKFQLRRPAIQKQFYDIEERVVVRPAGSALVELEEPHAKIQKGPAVINPVGGVAVGPAAPVAVAGPAPIAAAPIAVAGPAPIAAAPVAVAPTPIAITPSPIVVSTTPAPIFGAGPAGPIPGSRPVALQDDDSVVIDNPEFSFRSALSAESHQLDAEQRSIDVQQQQLQARQQELFERREHLSRSRTHTEARPVGPVPLPGVGQPGPVPLARAGPAVEVRTNGAPLDLVPRGRAGPDVIPSFRGLSPEVNQANQQRLIQLLTARGGVAEVGFGRAGPSPPPVGDAAPVRARVLSATPAPPHAEPAGERVSTRRVVVSRPIETVQDIDVVEPVTKLERVAVHHPTVFKTVHHDFARVPTSVPVLGKTLAPAIAHAAVPVGLGVGVGPVGYVH